MFFWNDPALKQPFWPKDVSFENIKRATKINLLMILQSYKEFTMKERVSFNQLAPISIS